MLTVRTQQFEGPLDLLLELIEKEDLDITSLSLAQVADEYIEKLKELEGQISMQKMSEFLEVASRLILIKSRALVPTFDLTEEEELSAEELELRLKEYKRFKEIGSKFKEKLTKELFSFDKLTHFTEETVFSPPPGISVSEISKAFKNVIGDLAAQEELEEEIVEEVVSLEEKVDHIVESVKDRMETCFHHLHGKGSKVEMIVTFLALLELLKQQAVKVRQDKLFREIRIENTNDI